METSLHRELKLLYAGRGPERGPWRAIASMPSLAGGCRNPARLAGGNPRQDPHLLKTHRVTVVKPIVAGKMSSRGREGGRVSRRLSPKRGQILDLFDELVHFTKVFPHRGLTLEVLLVEIEEWRYPGHGRRRRWRENDHEVEDQRLVAIHGKHRFRTAADVARLVRCPLPSPFHTGHLAESLGVRRWSASGLPIACTGRAR